MNYSTSSFPCENRWKISGSIPQMVPKASSWASTSPRSHRGSSRASTLHHQGLAIKLAHRNSNKGILRKALWGGDTWSSSGGLVTQWGVYKGLMLYKRLCSVPLIKCTCQTLFGQEQGGWCWPASSVPKEKGDGSKGSVGPLVTFGKCAELRKK